MKGFLSLVLHAHLPFVRHPEHDRFLEENWLFEAITETYVPLLQLLERWQTEFLHPRLTLTLTPPLCAMLQDPLLQERYLRHLNELITLAEQEIHRNYWQKPFHELAVFYHERLQSIRDYYLRNQRDLIAAFRKFQEFGNLEIITCAATHALLPLLTSHPASLRAQILVARDHYQQCFGRNSRGIWLPECAYVEGLETILQEAGLRWFITETHGILNARPRPRYAMFAPIVTPNGVAAFGRDVDSAKQVWSRDEGYPGDPRYRDFYRDIGFDLDLDYVRPYLPAPGKRGFTGIKYYRITDRSGSKEVYHRASAMQAVQDHAAHFAKARAEQFERLAGILDRPPIVVCPYDAELFGHWWYEGIEFLDSFIRKVCRDQNEFSLITPGDYLDREQEIQIATPAASSWGEGGHLSVWLNEKNQWIYPHLAIAQDRMSELAKKFAQPDALQERALKQAARELVLAQSSDWPFILRTGTSPEYARKRIEDHLLRFTKIYDDLITSRINAEWLTEIETRDNIFPEINYRYWLPNT